MMHQGSRRNKQICNWYIICAACARASIVQEEGPVNIIHWKEIYEKNIASDLYRANARAR